MFLSPSSPMDTVDQSSFTVTPHRKLSMTLDESGQTPTTSTYCSDNGCGDTLKSFQNGGLQYLRAKSNPENWNQPLYTNRSPLGGEIQNCGDGIKCASRTLLAKRSMKKPPEDEENVFHNYNSSPLDLQPLEFSSPSDRSRPSSLPVLSSSPLTHQLAGETNSKRPQIFIRKISIPLERMFKESPTGVPNQRTSRCSSSARSDGYNSEVFYNEGIDCDIPDLSDTLTSGPINDPTPMTNTFSNKSAVVCPIPVWPSFIDKTVVLNYFGETKLSSDGRRVSLKRSSPDNDINKFPVKKRPPLPFCNSEDSSPNSSRPVHDAVLLRSQSCSMQASPTHVSPGSGDEIGDYTKSYALPLVKGGHSDLKNISPETMHDLLEGKYASEIDRYTVLDCRFPYEYKGGHIKEAKNIWTQEQLLEFFFSELLQHPQEGFRSVFIFHCEFSSQRGPKMSRFLRETDRKRNGMAFPKLYYPELYLLKGGYSTFYKNYPEVCEPQAYCRMEDENHIDELKTCKLRSESWKGDFQTRRRPSIARHLTFKI